MVVSFLVGKPRQLNKHKKIRTGLAVADLWGLRVCYLRFEMTSDTIRSARRQTHTHATHAHGGFGVNGGGEVCFHRDKEITRYFSVVKPKFPGG
jgi:hypothetical protein